MASFISNPASFARKDERGFRHRVEAAHRHSGEQFRIRMCRRLRLQNSGILIAADDEGIEFVGSHPRPDVFVAAVDFVLTLASSLRALRDCTLVKRRVVPTGLHRFRVVTQGCRPGLSISSLVRDSVNSPPTVTFIGEHKRFGASFHLYISALLDYPA